MPKVKPHRTSPSLDMTPMVDLAFLLVTFFMLTTKFAPEESVVVDTPSSISELKLPENNVITLTIDKNKRVFFGVDAKQTKVQALQRVGAKYGVNFTAAQAKEFGDLPNFGIPINKLGSYLDMSKEDRKQINKSAEGVPTDSLNNQLIDWVLESRRANQSIFHKPTYIAIKGDGDADVPTVQKVIKILQERDINRFNLITDMENKPVAAQ
ncbi:ExbD/TolR family protein [Hymenobacter properus]|uniref:Biopolymer transporter ExbD n=1 Tax=Hymenobacter properus TaxID=2791026 RepID=A0A931FIZ0_9BACT|nr:biopolymer transporter ExbD [Hymenobacter properus]MBF9142482.1 biopolymer transporter ExbD [Hymenobacter properus]MBR7721289.1 biopolymer transporter ExbD [Microvirga sp. SRT04]